MKASQILKVHKTKGVCHNEGYGILHTHTHTLTHAHLKEPCKNEQLHELPQNSEGKTWFFLFL